MSTQEKPNQIEIIAALTNQEIDKVSNMIYKRAAYFVTKVFDIGDSYMCAPLVGRNPPDQERFNWTPCGVIYGRTVYQSKNELQDRKATQ